MPNEVPGKWCAEVLNKNLEVSKWRKVLPHQWHSPCCELDITAPALRGAPVKFGQNAGGVFLSEISKLLSGFLLFHLPLELCSWNINTFSYSLLVQEGFSTQLRCQESLRWCTRDPTGLSLAVHGAEMLSLVLQAVVSSPLNFQKKKDPLGKT